MSAASWPVQTEGAGKRSGRRLRSLLMPALVVAAVIGAVVLSVLAWRMVDEGAMPEVAQVPLPASATVMATGKQCGSGGCWRTISVAAPSSSTAEALAEAMGRSADQGERCVFRVPEFREVCWSVKVESERSVALEAWYGDIFG